MDLCEPSFMTQEMLHKTNAGASISPVIRCKSFLSMEKFGDILLSS